jgi:hypothetical protein
MKYLIYIVAIDHSQSLNKNSDYSKYCLNTWKYWCNKHNIDLHIATEHDNRFKYAVWNKELIYEIGQDYDKIGIIDSDTMIRWDAPNIFEQINEEIAGVVDTSDLRWILNSLNNYGDAFFKEWTQPDIDEYFNAGVLFFDKKYLNIFKQVLDFYLENKIKLDNWKKGGGKEQTVLNYFLTKNKVNKTDLFEKYCQITEGIRVNHDDGSKRIKYCLECKIEKILNIVESSYICPLCGDMEVIIIDEDVQIKDYSPYKRLNRFREWLNAFQAKQSPEIDNAIYNEIIDELNKRRITDLSILNREKMRNILKKLKFNYLYEHTHYIINKLTGLPSPKITRDMEKMFIRMFLMIQEPWSKYKPIDRKNFLSYSYVLHKFCELLELDHLLDCFPLHKQLDILMENDCIWKKICTDLNWDFISSFK